MELDEARTPRTTVSPPDSFTPEQRLCYWAYDVFIRTQEEQRGLTPEEAAAYSYLYRITTLVDNGQPVTAREQELYDTYLQVMDIYEALHSGGAVFGEPRYPWLRGQTKSKEEDHRWRITKYTSHIPLPEWRDIPHVAPPLASLRAPRHRLPPPPGWPNSEQLGYVPPEAVKLTRVERSDQRRKEKKAAREARVRIEDKRRWIAEEEAREEAEREEREKREKEELERKRARRIEAAKRRRELGAAANDGNEIDFEEEARKEAAMKKKEEEEARRKEIERRKKRTGFITVVDLKDGKLKEDERLKELVNLSFQEIGEPYQLQRFKLMLPRLTNVTTLVLSHNMIGDLSFAKFPTLEKLVVSGNDFWSLEKLPQCPKLLILDVSENNIWSLRGLKKFKVLKELNLKDNPITAENDYLPRVVKASRPSLIYLDDMPLDREKHLPKDYKFDEASKRKLDGGCAIM